MKYKRLATTLAAAAIAGGGALTAIAAPAHADSGWGHDRHGRHPLGHFAGLGHSGAAKLCVAKSHKKYVKKRGGGKFGKYFGKGNKRYVVKKTATKYVKCGAWHQHHHKRFGHKGFGHGKWDWGWNDWSW